ncbi:MAG TPA: S8 family serine peptidase [Phycisphaerales bacterium]|nr:S8 family serine peptidase [Phycisphaerales bacterium]
MSHREVSVRAARSLTARLALVVGLSLPFAASAGAQLQWRTGTSAIPPKLTADGLRDSLAALSARDAEAPRRVIVHLDHAISDAERRQFEQSGLNLLSYLGENAYFASFNRAALDAEALVATGAIDSTEQILPRYKLHPDLVAGVVQPWMVIDANAGEAADKQSAPTLEDQKNGPTVAVYVQFHKDVDAETVGADAVRRHGGEVRTVVEAARMVVAHIPMSQVSALADEDVVQNIEPPLPGFVELNAENRALTGANTIQAAPYSLNGSGVDVLIYDGGQIRATHQDLTPRVTAGDTAAVSDHSTHVAGTVGGTGAASGGNNRGMAPGVRKIISYAFEQPGGLTPGFLYTNPGDFIADYTAAINTHGADLSNNSIGTNTAPNGYDCNWEGDYGLMSELIDQMVRGSITGSPFRVCWANGNERQGSQRCGAQFHTTAPPSCAKNHIAVGSVNSNDDSNSSFTSWGPADDGRMKPDVSAPGCQVGGDGGVTSCSSSGDTAYAVKCGTSMATPTLTGLSAIVLQDYRSLYPSRPDPRNSFLKTLFAHTAVDLGNPGPDNQFGYGSVRIVPAIDLLRSGNFAEDSVSQGGVYGAIVIVQPGDPELKVTLAWDDFQGTGNMIPQLVNDLDLVVRSPSNVRAFPWTLGGLANPSAPAVRTSENHIDNIEQVFVQNPEPGAWSIEVRGTTVPSGPQPFSLTGTPFLVNCSTRGVASLDNAVYPCSDTVAIRVSDCDLNTSDAVVDTVTVNLASNSEPGGEMVVLTETAAQSAEFRANVAISTTDSSGVLHVGNGDTITLTYIDANDGFGGINVPVVVTASVDCAPPVITDVVAANVQPRSATITFTTNEPATGAASYGTSCGSLSGNASSSTRTTTHSINLTGLQTNTTYSFTVRATDDAGNLGTNDNGGTCFTFSTPEVPDFFTELFDTANPHDLDFKSTTFIPAGGVDGYTACTETITSLPVDPTSHTGITFPSTQDDQFVQLTVSGGQSVKLYGTSYTNVYVGSNGYLTFTAGDTDYTETFADHFDTPRISGLFNDLDPGQAGVVRWAQLADSFVVTWVGVTHHNGSNSNTFQIRMFFDGAINISSTAVADSDGLTGLSRGVGLDPDFFESDISAYGACGPRPPVASNGSATTAVATAAEVLLEATDDGLPAQPLTYKIVTLPAHGMLRTSGGAAVTSVPFTLPDNYVRYAPLGVYQGGDSFQFRANDGGVSPEGGDSNLGTIDVTVGGPQPVLSFLTDDTDPSWTAEGSWAFGHPTGAGSHNHDPSNGFTGSNVLGYNLAGDYTSSMPERHITSGPINLSGVTNTQISFQRWLGIESATYDHAYLKISTDAVNWTTLFSHTGAALNPTAWSEVSYDASAVADNQAVVYLRFTMGVTDPSVTYPGWNIDDIVISGSVPLSPCDGDVNFDGQVTLGDIAVVIQGWASQAAAIRDGDANYDGAVGLPDIAVVIQHWAQICP